MLTNVNLHKEVEEHLDVRTNDFPEVGSSSSSSSSNSVFIARVAALHCGLPLSPPQVRLDNSTFNS
jgi:hypothetical protein